MVIYSALARCAASLSWFEFAHKKFIETNEDNSMEYIDLAGLANFGAYFSTALVALLAFKYIILWITPYDEWKLIKLMPR